MDQLVSAARSDLMRRIRGSRTKPERAVATIARKLVGYVRLNAKSLPGQPDIAVFRTRKAILVHGCFWHQHRGCRRSNIPKSNRRYWIPKLARNTRRDKENIRDLRKLGWKVLVVWECQCRETNALTRRLERFLSTQP
jgi:DNA mismatch endonuclease (patch repair protein)